MFSFFNILVKLVNAPFSTSWFLKSIAYLTPQKCQIVAVDNEWDIVNAARAKKQGHDTGLVPLALIFLVVRTPVKLSSVCWSVYVDNRGSFALLCWTIFSQSVKLLNGWNFLLRLIYWKKLLGIIKKTEVLSPGPVGHCWCSTRAHIAHVCTS